MNENTTMQSKDGMVNPEITQVKSKGTKKGLKKIIAFILVGILCFGGGILTDRLMIRSGFRRGLNRNGNFKQFNRNRTQAPSSNTSPNGQSNQ